jgi:hypothetical protein
MDLYGWTAMPVGFCNGRQVSVTHRVIVIAIAQVGNAMPEIWRGLARESSHCESTMDKLHFVALTVPAPYREPQTADRLKKLPRRHISFGSSYHSSGAERRDEAQTPVRV